MFPVTFFFFSSMSEIDDYTRNFVFLFSFFFIYLFFSFTLSREMALIFNDTLDGHPSRANEPRGNEISWKNPRYLDKFARYLTWLRKKMRIFFRSNTFSSPRD